MARLASEERKLDHILIEAVASRSLSPLPKRSPSRMTVPRERRRPAGYTRHGGGRFLVPAGTVQPRTSTRGWEATRQDERTVAHLFCDQLEFANVIVMNKMDLMDEDSKTRLRAVLGRFNPDAQLIEATHGQVPPESAGHRAL